MMLWGGYITPEQKKKIIMVKKINNFTLYRSHLSGGDST